MALKGLKYKPNIVVSHGKEQYRVIGTRPIRQDGYERVTGRARYTADTNLPGMLHAKVLRSPFPHARIKFIDTSKAESFPGVKAVVTSKDFNFTDKQIRDLAGFAPYQNVIACDKVFYVGHAVAAVAADDPHVAEEALSLIKIDYQPLPLVMDARDAMKKGAPLLHNHLTTAVNGVDTGKVSNVAGHAHYEKGDVQKGFKEADVVVEREFYTSTVHQGYIESHASLANWDMDGRVYLWTSTQGNHRSRDITARVLGIPPFRVKVTPSEIGGGFGGKLTAYLEPLAAMLSRKSGKPVKATMTRKEIIENTGPAPATYIKVRMGVKKNGRITAAQAYMVYELGAFLGATAMNRGAIIIFAPYDVDNVLVDGYEVVVNKPKTQAYRAPGSAQAVFAAEQIVDELAEKIGMDPLELRHRNAAHEGTRRHDGVVNQRIGFKEVLEAAMNHPHYKSPLQPNGSDGKLRGRGVATGFWANAGALSSAHLTVQFDGSVTMVTGSVDLAGNRTALAMQAAEVLGISFDDVQPVVGDTDSVGNSAFSAGSRTVFATGIAVLEAAQKLTDLMKERLALIWDISANQIEFKGGVFSSKTDKKRKMSFKDLGSQLENTGGTLTASATVDPKGVGATLGTHIADVEVDPETGKVDVLRYTVIQDAGKAIHPSYVEGQMQGGAVQGIGWALNEEFYYDDKGRVVNCSLLDYRMPTSLDVPMIDTVIVEVPSQSHPFGVRGVGENNIIAPAATVANAIYHATGVRFNKLPMKPGNIIAGLSRDQKKEAERKKTR